MLKVDSALAVRGSRAPTAAECPGSIALSELIPQVEFEEAHPASIGGTIHRCLAQFLRGKHIQIPIDDTQEKVSYPVHVGMNLWQYGIPDQDCPPLMDVMSGQLYVEYPVKIGKKTGTLDLASYDNESKTLTVLDWKSGWARLSHWPQLAFYAALFCIQEQVEPGKIQAILVHLRHKDLEWRDFDVAELDAFLTRINANAFDAVIWLNQKPEDRTLSVFTEGPHCLQCHAQTFCPAKHALLAPILQDPEMALDRATVRIHELEPAQLGTLYVQCRAIERYVEQAKKIIQAEIIGRDGIPFGDGKRLGVVRPTSIAIDLTKCSDYLRTATVTVGDKKGTTEIRVFNDEMEFLNVLEISTGRLKDHLQEKAPRGLKKQAYEALTEELEARRALQRMPREPYVTVMNETPEQEA